MQKLQDIAVMVEPKDDVPLNHLNATPILHEILHALQRLATQGEPTTIDLRAIPFGPGDEDALLNQLGMGEVKIELDTLGKSTIWETAFSGVWIIDHQNAESERIALQIEVAHIPAIIKAQTEDVTESLQLLDNQLNPNRTETTGLREE
ncbi:MAG: hydrogenase expression/formation protein [Candidatus Thiodiazotropha sp. (ex Monitilora ramsayi)]|nr:hydrogenase expression/formation protein [Candidatus Thiodiazotropha sp. (ex Monitilora ramsayi)]